MAGPTYSSRGAPLIAKPALTLENIEGEQPTLSEPQTTVSGRRPWGPRQSPEEVPLNTEVVPVQSQDAGRRSVIKRRAFVGAAAWSIPVITVAAAAPAFAASGRAMTKTAPGELGTDFAASATSTTQPLSVQVTRNGTSQQGRTISFSVSPLTGDTDTSWLTFSPVGASTDANGVATTALSYGVKANGRKPTVESTYRVLALDAGDTDLSVMWTLTYTPTRVTVFSSDFNSIGPAPSGTATLPAGFTVRTGGQTTFPGTAVTYVTAATTWADTAGNFRNVASATGLTSSANSAAQSASTNRAIAVRQSGSLGDPGAAFVVNLGPIGSHTDVRLSFRLQSLDSASTVLRTATWLVDGGTSAANRVAATTSGSMTTTATFKNDVITADFGSSLDGLTGDVYVRIVTRTATTGSGSRPTTAIDDLTVTWI